MSTLRTDSADAGAGAAEGALAFSGEGAGAELLAGAVVASGALACAKTAPCAPIAITASHTALQHVGGPFFFMSCIYSSF
jgi:hypothetical protein